MKQVVFAQENVNNQSIINDIFRVRHETFIERLGWDITSTNGMERDRFDDLAPYHIAIKPQDSGVVGCWRALPTKGDYMLKSIFQELLQGENVPEQEDVWEISRFAVRKGQGEGSAYMSNITMDLFDSFIEFAKMKGIKKYVTVTTLACERILKRGGMAVHRMGEGKVMQVGVERTVALWIDLEASERMYQC